MLNPRLTLVGVSFLLLAMLGRLAADDPAVNASASGSSSTSNGSGTPVTSGGSTSDNSSDNSSSDNSQSNDNTLPPDKSQSSSSNQIPATPYLPQQQANPYSPFTLTPSTLNAQDPQITAPNLYTTGTTSVSQIATNNALFQAFTDQSAGGFDSSDQIAGYSHPPIERIRIGPFDLKAALASNIVYDDDLRAGNNNGPGQDQGSKGDTEYDFTPAVMLVYGAHEEQKGYATLVYTPTISRYFHHTDQNDINQNVAFNATYPFQRLTLNFSESFSQVAGVNQDTQTRTTQSSNFTSLGGTYIVDDKLTFSSNLQHVITSFSNPSGGSSNGVGSGGESTSINSNLSYQITDKISAGPSINFGIDKTDGEPQETYEQGLMGVAYQPRPKINFFVQAGVELRQSDSSGNNSNQSGGDETDPVFSAGLSYSPFESTSLVLNASQSLHTSTAESSGQTVVNSSVDVSLNQRFFQRLFLNLDFNYSHNDDQNGAGTSDANAVAISSNNDQYSYRANVSFSPTAWSSLGLYYQYLDNESGSNADSYHDNQIGLSVSAQF